MLFKTLSLLLSNSKWLAQTICKLRNTSFCVICPLQKLYFFFFFFLSFYFHACWLLSQPFYPVAFRYYKLPGKKFSFDKDKVSCLFYMVQRSWWKIRDRKQLVILLTGSGTQSFVTLNQKPLETCNKQGAPAWGLILGWQRGIVLLRNGL